MTLSQLIDIETVTPLTPTGNPLPSLKFHCVEFSGGLLWSQGGQAPDNITGAAEFYSDVHVIDPSSSSATIEAGLPLAVAHSHGVITNGYAVLVGGMCWNSALGAVISANAVQTTNLSTRQSTVGGYLAQSVYDPIGCLLSSGQILVAGGHTGTGDTAAGQVLTVNADGSVSFSASLALQYPRTYGTMHQRSDGKVLVIGGAAFNANGTVSQPAETELVDPVALLSQVCGSLNVPRHYHCSRLLTSLSKIIVAGGVSTAASGRPPACASIESIDPATGSSTMIGALVHPRYHANSFAVTIAGGEYMVVYGGTSETGIPVNSVEMIDPTTGESQIIAELDWAVDDHDRILACNGNKAYILGGELAGSNPVGGSNKLVTLTFQSGAMCYRA